ncbi:hypothetical protein [Brevundimonas sp.]|uniref:hypothetical protein n=1 Tax=Brevundimonas sp. TaxID=1871086 RepID=UPI0028A21E36|nr:hypothetical protein [Brevundimonas sp.]
MTGSPLLLAALAAGLLVLLWRGLISPTRFAQTLGGLAAGAVWIGMEAGHG